MLEALSQMLWPLLACFILVGIHAYLGIHVIARKVIFVDLALAQIAALGAVYGVFLGLSFESDALIIKGVSVIFTLLGAVVFSFTRTPDERVPHEAIIGIIYAAALSMTLLLTANLPHGADEVSQMLAGNILWVTKSEVIYTALLYGMIGLIHVVFHKQFFLFSTHDIAIKNINIKLWDFLFYATFGVVVTSSVGMAGVLLVFGYLIIPSVIGIMLAHSTRARLLYGWASGLVMSTAGVIISYYLDLPSGPTIVVLLGVLLVIIVMIREIAKSSGRKQGIFHLLWVSVVLLLIIFLPMSVGSMLKAKSSAAEQAHLFSHNDLPKDQKEELLKLALASTNKDEQENALLYIKDQKLSAFFDAVVPFLWAVEAKERELAIATLMALDQEKAVVKLKGAVAQEKDVFIKMHMAEILLAAGYKEALLILATIAKTSPSEFARVDAVNHLTTWIEGSPNDKDTLLLWLDKHKAAIVYDADTKKYHLKP